MKPYLNVLGRKHSIISVGVKNEETGEIKNFFDNEFFSTLDESEKADFSQAIENPKHTERLIERLETTIKESKDYLMELKMQIVENVIENINLPFLDENLKSIVDDIKSQTTFIEALEMALDIAKGGRKWDFEKAVSEVSSTDE